MGLAPIPASLCKHKAVFKMYYPATTADKRYQKQTYPYDITVDKVHVQIGTTILKGADNTEVQVKGTIFMDPKRAPQADQVPTIMDVSLSMGKPLRVEVFNAGGGSLGTYEVLQIDKLPDVPSDRIHHYEVLLV